MFYEPVAEDLAQAPVHLPAHRERLDLFQARGTLIMAGPLLDGTHRALGIFTTREAAEDFIQGDPFVVHGVVKRWTIAEWAEVLI